MSENLEGFAFFIQKEEAREALIWNCFRRLFDPDFVPAADPVHSEEKTDDIDFWQAYHFLDCDPEDCIHKDAVILDILWRREPLTSLFVEVQTEHSAEELALWNPISPPLEELWDSGDEGFGDVITVLTYANEEWSDDDYWEH
jgi:hypothetical protein